MDANIERKLPHIRQLFNILFGFAIGANIFSLRLALDADWQILFTQFLIFIFSGALITYAWWRQASMMNTSSLTKITTLTVLAFRISLVYLLVYAVRTLSAADSSSVFYWIFFLLAAAALIIISFVGQLIKIKPLYGKSRVLHRREVLTDFLLLLVICGFFAGVLFAQKLFMNWPGFLIIFIAAFFVRPLAKKLTIWKELPPPHRGRRSPSPESAGRFRDKPKPAYDSSRAKADRFSSSRRSSSKLPPSRVRNSRPVKDRKNRYQDESKSTGSFSSKNRKSPLAKPASPDTHKRTQTRKAPRENGNRTVPKNVEPTENKPKDTEEARDLYGRKKIRIGPTPSELGLEATDTLSPEKDKNQKSLLMETNALEGRGDLKPTSGYGRRRRKNQPDLFTDEAQKDDFAKEPSEGPQADQKAETSKSEKNKTEPDQA